MRLTIPHLTTEVASVRTTARLVSDEHDIELWFEAPARWQIDRSCAPFVPVATVLATALGADDLVIEGPIPEPLLTGARLASGPIATHFRQARLAIEAEVRPVPVVPAGRRVALFFSRGVDSSANLVLADRGELEPRPDLVIIGSGLDPANSPDLEATLTAESVAAARVFDLDSVVVSSNLRDVIDRHMWWIEGFGQVLAGIGLLLSRHVSDAIISSAVPDQQFYTGAHPDLDPLWGNGIVTFHHLPRHLERSERVRLIVEDGRPIEFLRVCWAGGPNNCGRCRKCMQTASLIAAFGGDPSPVFADTDVSPEDIRRQGPGHILRADYVDAAPPELAAAAAERLDAVDGRMGPGGLLRAARAAPNGSDEWLVVGSPGAATAAIVDAALAHGPGTVLADAATLTTHVLRLAASRAGVTLWSTVDPATDGQRALACLQSGSRPLIIVPESALERSRAMLSEPMRPLLGSVADIATTLTDGATDAADLARVLTGGGIGWMQP